MKARGCAVVMLPNGEIRLTVTPTKGRPAVVDLLSTDAEAVGSVLKAVARKDRAGDFIDALRADRDALIAALEILDGPDQLELAA